MHVSEATPSGYIFDEFLCVSLLVNPAGYITLLVGCGNFQFGKKVNSFSISLELKLKLRNHIYKEETEWGLWQNQFLHQFSCTELSKCWYLLGLLFLHFLWWRFLLFLIATNRLAKYRNDLQLEPVFCAERFLEGKEGLSSFLSLSFRV